MINVRCNDNDNDNYYVTLCMYVCYNIIIIQKL